MRCRCRHPPPALVLVLLPLSCVPPLAVVRESCLQEHRTEPPQPDPVAAATPADPPTIFVSVAAFRDPNVGATLEDMYRRAAVPQRVHVGLVCQLHADRDVPCIPPGWSDLGCAGADWCPSDQVRVRSIGAAHARGPTYARYLASRLYRGEDYFLMIDAHNRFVAGWDEMLVDMHQRCPAGNRCVLSHYPEAFEPRKQLENTTTVSYLCGARWNEDGYVEFNAAVVKKASSPRLQPYASAGLLFARGTVVREVPFDPFLPFLFAGEEFLMTARLWTHGYDLYSPPANVLFHMYYRNNEPKVWAEPDNQWYKHQRLSVQRLQWILGLTEAHTRNLIVPEETQDEHVVAGMGPSRRFGRYGLGRARTMEQYWEFSKHDPVHRRAVDGHYWCSRP